MKTDDHSEMDQNQNVFEGRLLPGEQIVWREKGVVRYRTGLIAFGIVWLAASLLWTYMGYRSGGVKYALFGIPFIAIGIAVLLLARRKKQPNQYALTNKRVLIFQNGRLSEMGLEKLSKADTRPSHNGIRELILCEKRSVKGVGDVDTVIFRITDINDAENVCGLISSQRDRLTAIR